MKRLLLLFLIVVNVMITADSFSQSISLDPSFGIEGIVRKDINELLGSGAATRKIKKIIEQEDGKILCLSERGAYGSSFDATKVVIARYLPEGIPDPIFGNQGFVISDFTLNDIALQNDGKIIGLGQKQNTDGVNEVAIVRYNPNGFFDNSFGNEGVKMMLGVSATENPLQQVLIQEDGKILIGGAVYIMTYETNFRLIRLLQNGDLDPDFGVGGMVNTNIVAYDYFGKMRLTNDGKILVIGTVCLTLPTYGSPGGDHNENYRLGFARYNMDGTLDTSFGSGGIKDFADPVFFGDVRFRDFVILADNSIVVAGTKAFYDPNNSKFQGYILKFNSAAVLDGSFGNNGIILKDGGATENWLAISIAVDSSNHILAGYIKIGATRNLALGRYTQNGIPDMSVGEQGIFTVPVLESDFLSLVVLSDNKILMGGSNQSNLLLLRLNNVALSTDSFNLDAISCSVYPNPIKESTVFNFNLKTDECLTIQLYNANGNLIKTIVEDRNYSEGYHNEELDINDALPKGVYFLKITNKHISKTIKLIK